MPPRRKSEEKSSAAMATPNPTTSTSESSSPSAAENAKAVTCIKAILKDGKINPKQESNNKAILKSFLENLLRVMKEQDTRFAALFQKLYYTGSYYENLRISDPNEFDINIVLKLPFSTDVRTIEYSSNVKSFVKYKLKRENNNSVLENNVDLIRTLFEGEYLMPSKVRSWIQGIVDRALASLPSIKGIQKIIPSASGPAKTMFLETVYGYNIDVDLVPVIQFSHPEWPKDARKDMINKFQIGKEDQLWFLVPKDVQADRATIDVIDKPRFWRIHFPEVEKKIIHDRGAVKPVIKLLKALRNNEDWKILASYYLKTVVLWMVERNPSTDYWKDDNQYKRLLEALEHLKENVSRKVINYYFYPSYNLIQKIPPAQADIICNRLGKIIKDIKANPESKLAEYFKF